jgi:hypothetical protein
MPHTSDFDHSAAGLDPIHDTARVANYLTDHRIAELRYDSSGFRKRRKAFDRVKEAADEFPGGRGVILRNACEYLSQIESGGGRPRQSASH